MDKFHYTTFKTMHGKEITSLRLRLRPNRYPMEMIFHKLVQAHTAISVVFFCFVTVVTDGKYSPYWCSRGYSSELMELSSINRVSLLKR